MPESKELQEMILTYRLLESRLTSPDNGLLKQRDMLISKLIDVQNTLQSVDELIKGGADVLFNIGSETYVVGNVKDRGKMISEIGANVALEKTPQEVRESLEKRKSEIELDLKAVQNGINDITSNMENLEAEIQEMSRELQKGPGEK
jgi:prefoldin alpha subunit